MPLVREHSRGSGVLCECSPHPAPSAHFPTAESVPCMGHRHFSLLSSVGPWARGHRAACGWGNSCVGLDVTGRADRCGEKRGLGGGRGQQRGRRSLGWTPGWLGCAPTWPRNSVSSRKRRCHGRLQGGRGGLLPWVAPPPAHCRLGLGLRRGEHGCPRCPQGVG